VFLQEKQAVKARNFVKAKQYATTIEEVQIKHTYSMKPTKK